MKRNTTFRVGTYHPTRVFVLGAVAAAVAVLFPGFAAAHALKAQVSPLSDPIRVEAWYDDDTPAEQARVVVTREGGEVVATGTLDETGIWSFPKPGPGRYTIVVEITGHRDAVRLDVPETAAPVAYVGSQVDQPLGLAVGLLGLLGGTLAFIYFRRPGSSRPDRS